MKPQYVFLLVAFNILNLHCAKERTLEVSTATPPAQVPTPPVPVPPAPVPPPPLPDPGKKDPSKKNEDTKKTPPPKEDRKPARNPSHALEYKLPEIRTSFAFRDKETHLYKRFERYFQPNDLRKGETGSLLLRVDPVGQFWQRGFERSLESKDPSAETFVAKFLGVEARYAEVARNPREFAVEILAQKSPETLFRSAFLMLKEEVRIGLLIDKLALPEVFAYDTETWILRAVSRQPDLAKNEELNRLLSRPDPRFEQLRHRVDAVAGNAGATRALFEDLKKNPKHRKNRIALGALGTEEAIRHLWETYDAQFERENERKPTLEALELAPSKAVIAQTVSLLDVTQKLTTDVVLTAIRALAATGDQEAVPPLKTALHDRLEQIHKEGKPYVTRRFDTGTKCLSIEREGILESLAQLDGVNEEAWTEIETLAHSDHPAHRQKATRILRRLGHSERAEDLLNQIAEIRTQATAGDPTRPRNYTDDALFAIRYEAMATLGAWQRGGNPKEEDQD